MQAIIMCAGKSTRTWPLTITKPKPLLKVVNKTILEHNLTQLQGLVSEVILIVGFKKEMIKEKIGTKFGKLKIKYIEQKEQNGTGGALLTVKKYTKEKFLVMNGDDFFSKKDIAKCIKHKYCVLGKEVNELFRFGELVVKNKQIVKIKEKPEKSKGIANTGLYVFTTKVFEHKLKKSPRGELEITDYVDYLIKNEKVNYETVEEYWFPITYPWNLLEANEFFLTKIKKQIKGKIETFVTINGPIVIGKNTIIKSGAYIEGPVVIGENCVIGPNCFIRKGTTIGNNSKIGNGVDVKNSIIGDNTCIAHLAYVGDSIIGDIVNVAAGCVTANLRHDKTTIKSPIRGMLVDSSRKKLGAIVGDNVNLGINTSIYPGRKIWPNKTTLPGEIVKKDVV